MKKGSKNTQIKQKTSEQNTPAPKPETTASAGPVTCPCGKGCKMSPVPPDGRRSTVEGRRFRGECGRTVKQSLRAVPRA